MFHTKDSLTYPMNNFLKVLIICLFIITFSQARQITLRNLKLYDKQNRQMTFHGTNIVVKVPPYIPSTGAYNATWSFGPSDIQLLRKNGFNAIRLGIMWAGLQPQKDKYNQTFLQEMVNIVNRAGEAGIYSIVQFHQDLLSESFCGDGVPIWLMQQLHAYKTFPIPMGKKIKPNSSKLPDWKDCDQDNWGNYYFSYDVGQGFNNLYNSEHKLNHKFIDYWRKVATAFKNNPYVIAYELINEPFIGNFWRNPLLVVPSMAQRWKLQGFYDKLSAKIRQIDADTPICFEPVTFDNFVPTGFSHAPGGKRYNNQSMFCYHHYQPPALSLKSLDTYVQDGKKLGIASILSETWGAAETLSRAQYWKQSWMYWIYKDFGKNWGMPGYKEKLAESPPLDALLRAPSDGISDHLIRTYFQRVAGDLENSAFNPATGRFTGSYIAKMGGQTILFINKQRTYNNAFQINIYPKTLIEVTQTSENFFTLKYIGSSPSGQKILVTVIKL